jgi:D-serine deaminase-like pyridoxal phosphate-dependent protein
MCNWRKTERLTEVRYRNGAIALKNLIDAQKTTRDALPVFGSSQAKPIQCLCDIDAGFGRQSN